MCPWWWMALLATTFGTLVVPLALGASGHPRRTKGDAPVLGDLTMGQVDDEGRHFRYKGWHQPSRNVLRELGSSPHPLSEAHMYFDYDVHLVDNFFNFDTIPEDFIAIERDVMRARGLTVTFANEEACDRHRGTFVPGEVLNGGLSWGYHDDEGHLSSFFERQIADVERVNATTLWIPTNRSSLFDALGPESHIEVIAQTRIGGDAEPATIPHRKPQIHLQSGNSIGSISYPRAGTNLLRNDDSVRVRWDYNSISGHEGSLYLYLDESLDTLVRTLTVPVEDLNAGYHDVSLASAGLPDNKSGPFYFLLQVDCGYLSCTVNVQSERFSIGSVGALSKPAYMAIFSRSSTPVPISWTPSPVTVGENPSYLKLYLDVPLGSGGYGTGFDKLIARWNVSPSNIDSGNFHVSFASIDASAWLDTSGNFSSGPYFFELEVRCGTVHCDEEVQSKRFMVDPETYSEGIEADIDLLYSFGCGDCPGFPWNPSDLSAWQNVFCALCLDDPDRESSLKMELGCTECAGQYEYSFTRFYITSTGTYDVEVVGSASATLDASFSMSYEMEQEGEVVLFQYVHDISLALAKISMNIDYEFKVSVPFNIAIDATAEMTLKGTPALSFRAGANNNGMYHDDSVTDLSSTFFQVNADANVDVDIELQFSVFAELLQIVEVDISAGAYVNANAQFQYPAFPPLSTTYLPPDSDDTTTWGECNRGHYMEYTVSWGWTAVQASASILVTIGYGWPVYSNSYAEVLRPASAPTVVLSGCLLESNSTAANTTLLRFNSDFANNKTNQFNIKSDLSKALNVSLYQVIVMDDDVASSTETRVLVGLLPTTTDDGMVTETSESLTSRLQEMMDNMDPRLFQNGIATASLIACGNFVTEGDEECDGGDCCASDCTLLDSDTMCRQASGLCDAAEVCTGTSSICPADAVQSSGTVCRGSAGPCDPAETCDGASPLCPLDQWSNSSVICRASAGTCDVEEMCTGSSASCPSDTFLSSDTTCRASAGICDVEEKCTGSSTLCSLDARKLNGTICRPSRGTCDPAEFCNGTSFWCPVDLFSNKTEPGVCGCGVEDVDSDSDGVLDCNDNCPTDGNKTEAGVCGCGISDVDTDSDGTLDCNDGCINDENKDEPGVCGCGVAEVDTDSDGTLDCNDDCPEDAGKTEPGACGCGISDVDTDSDESLDCNDECQEDAGKTEPGLCGCGISDVDTDSDGTLDCNDGCINDENKDEPGVCGCGVADVDTDSDGTLDCNDECQEDPAKTEPGLCGCGISDVDSDSDATPDCSDDCPQDENKTEVGICGCGISDDDSDNDGTSDCNDNCPTDENKTESGICGCGNSDIDSDNDGTANCHDSCPADENKIVAGDCGCGNSDVDTDLDGTPNCLDTCPEDGNKTEPGTCGCGTSDVDSDNDGTKNCDDNCPNDGNKVESGICGCGTPDTDTDGDGVADCNDNCDEDSSKVEPGLCGCGTADTDNDNDGTPNCQDECPNDPAKTVPGACGCGIADNDTDADGTLNCFDECPEDPNKTEPQVCGCGTPDDDTDNDGTLDCQDNCPNDGNKIEPGPCGCSVPDTDSDSDGTADCNDNCATDPSKTDAGQCGCGVVDTDSDSDGTADCNDSCANDPNKTEPGICGCGIADTDSDSDGTADCNETCDNDPNKTSPGACGCGTADTDSDGDGILNCNETCDNDPNKTSPGECGCGTADTDQDGDGSMDCNETCDNDPRKTVPGVCGCGQLDLDVDKDSVYVCQGDECDFNPLKTTPNLCGCQLADLDANENGIVDCLETDTDGDGVEDGVDNCPLDANANQLDEDQDGIGALCDVDDIDECASNPCVNGLCQNFPAYFACVCPPDFEGSRCAIPNEKPAVSVNATVVSVVIPEEFGLACDRVAILEDLALLGFNTSSIIIGSCEIVADQSVRLLAATSDGESKMSILKLLVLEEGSDATGGYTESAELVDRLKTADLSETRILKAALNDLIKVEGRQENKLNLCSDGRWEVAGQCQLSQAQSSDASSALYSASWIVTTGVFWVCAFFFQI